MAPAYWTHCMYYHPETIFGNRYNRHAPWTRAAGFGERAGLPFLTGHASRCAAAVLTRAAKGIADAEAFLDPDLAIIFLLPGQPSRRRM